MRKVSDLTVDELQVLIEDAVLAALEQKEPKAAPLTLEHIKACMAFTSGRAAGEALDLKDFPTP